MTRLCTAHFLGILQEFSKIQAMHLQLKSGQHLIVRVRNCCNSVFAFSKNNRQAIEKGHVKSGTAIRHIYST